jgi:hypothetical protein
MTPPSLEDVLADHLHERASRVSAPPGAAPAAAIARRLGVLRRRRRSRRAAVVLIGAAAVAVAGVIALPDDPDVEVDREPPVEEPEVLPGPPPTFPLARARGDYTAVVRNQAANLLTSDCLVAQGYGPVPADYVYSGPTQYAPPDGRRVYATSRFGVVDSEQVRAYGYRGSTDIQFLLRDVEERMRRAAGAEPLYTADDITPEAVAAYQACSAQSDAQLGGADVPLGLAVEIGRMETRALDATAADPRIAAATEDWRDCMAGKGHDFASPLAAMEHFAGPGLRPSSDPEPTVAPPPSEQEVAVGLADVACKQEVGLETAWIAVETEHQEAEIATRADEIAAAMTHNDEVAARAQAVVDAHGGG